MKASFLLFLLLSSAAAEISLGGNCANIEQVSRKIAMDWQDAYNSGHAEKVAALYADDAYYLTQHFVTGIVHGRPNIRAYVQHGVDAKYHVDSIRILSTDCSGDLAYSVARYESTNAGQKAFGLNIVVIKKFGNAWRIVAHEATVPDVSAAIKELKVSGPGSK